MAISIRVITHERRASFDSGTNTARFVTKNGEGNVIDFRIEVARVPNPHTGVDDVKLIPLLTIEWKVGRAVKVGAAAPTETDWTETGVLPADVFLK